MELTNIWPILLVVFLVSAALVLVCLYGHRTRGGSHDGRLFTLEVGDQREPASALVIGPAAAIVVRPSVAETLIIGPCRQEVLVIGPEQVVTIQPPQRAAWDDRGWIKHSEKNQEIYEGMYRVAERRSDRRLRFRGTVMVQGREVLTYIADPPLQIRHHPKHACFQLAQPPWFKVHWHRPARNVDEAILYVERVLDEAINARRAAG